MNRGFIYTISAFAISVVFLTSLSFLYTDRLTAYIRSRNAIDKSQQLIIQLYRLAYYIREVERNQRSFLLSKDTMFLAGFDSAVAQVNASRDSLNKLVDSDNALRPRFNALRLSLHDRISELRRTALASEEDSVNVIEAILKSHPLRNRIFEFIQVMEQEETHELNVHLQKQRSYERVNRADFQLLFFFALIIFIISFVVLLREIRLRVIYHKRMEAEIKHTNQANKELERITFVASHDLQEPLRKIRTFSNMLASKQGDALQPESKAIIQRIEHSADVMHELIRDLAHYTNLVSHNQQPRKTDLNEVVQDVKTKFNARLEQSKAGLTVDWLPIVNGYPEQLFMLFSALLDNSLKFSRPGVTPEIVITHESVKGHLVPHEDERKHYIHFHKITFTDNGLGFDSAFAEKIFGMFQRLHNQDTLFAGRGMGLAIAKRVMMNHDGYIIASGRTGEGASFFLYFPA